MENIWVALILAFAAGISTGIGGLVIFFVKKFKHEYLSLCMGFSAGVMIYVSFVEMLGRAALDIGSLQANIAFSLESCSSTSWIFLSRTSARKNTSKSAQSAARKNT